LTQIKIKLKAPIGFAWLRNAGRPRLSHGTMSHANSIHGLRVVDSSQRRRRSFPARKDRIFQEDMMPVKSSAAAPGVLGAEELRSVLGEVDDAKLIEVLKLQPTLAELEEAAIWATGNGDILAKGGRPMTGTVAAIIEILTADEEEEPPPVR
jgi:hypothetical protein